MNNDNIKENSVQAIIHNFSELNEKFLQENRDYIRNHCPEIKKLSEIPELEDITMKHIKKAGDALKIILTTEFTGDVYLLLSKKKFVSNKIKPRHPQERGFVEIEIPQGEFLLRITLYQSSGVHVS